MLYLIGLGLGDQDDITVKGLKAIQTCSKVYLEAYTSVLGVDKAALVAQNSIQSIFNIFSGGNVRQDYYYC